MNHQTPRTRDSRIVQTRSGALYLLLLTLIAPATVIAGPQQANEPETLSATVSLANLDLTTPAGISAAHQRLAAAAQHLCHKFSDPNKIDNYASLSACYHETLANAVRRFDAQLKPASADGTEVARNTP